MGAAWHARLLAESFAMDLDDLPDDEVVEEVKKPPVAVAVEKPPPKVVNALTVTQEPKPEPRGTKREWNKASHVKGGR